MTAQMTDLTNEPKVIANELIPVGNELQLAANEPNPGNTPVTHFNIQPTLHPNEVDNGTYSMTYATNALLPNNAVQNSTLVTDGSVDSRNNVPYTTSDPSLANIQPSLATIQPYLATIQPYLANIQPSVATIQPYLATNEINQITNQPTSFTTQLLNMTTEPSHAVSDHGNVKRVPVSMASELKNVQTPSNRFDVSIVLGMKNAVCTNYLFFFKKNTLY